MTTSTVEPKTNGSPVDANNRRKVHRNAKAFERANPEKPAQFPRCFELSDIYPYLSNRERTVIVVARTLCSRFSRGKSVNRNVISRICAKYHRMNNRQVRLAVRDLMSRGIFDADSHDIWLLPSVAPWLSRERLIKNAIQLIDVTAKAAGFSVAELLQQIERAE